MKKILLLFLVLSLVLASISTALACETHGIEVDRFIKSFMTYTYLSKNLHFAETNYTFECKECGGRRTITGEKAKEPHSFMEMIDDAEGECVIPHAVIHRCIKCYYQTPTKISIQ